LVRNQGTYEDGWVGPKGPDGRTVNCQTGCKGDCAYCYARLLADQYGWCKWENWTNPVIRVKDVKKNYKQNLRGRAMFPSSHNIDDTNVVEAIKVLFKLLKAHYQVLVVMKPDPDVVDTICDKLNYNLVNVEFRFSITTNDDHLRKIIEPGTPAIDARFESIKRLKKYQNKHVKKSVHIGPFIDTRPWEVAEEAVKLGLKEHEIWIEQMNHRAKLYAKSPILAKYQERFECLYSPRSLLAIKRTIETCGLHINYKRCYLDAMLKEKPITDILSSKA